MQNLSHSIVFISIHLRYAHFIELSGFCGIFLLITRLLEEVGLFYKPHVVLQAFKHQFVFMIYSVLNKTLYTKNT